MISAADPIDEPGSLWVNMAATVSAPDGRFTWQDKLYTAPGPGTYRIGIFDERKVRGNRSSVGEHQPESAFRR